MEQTKSQQASKTRQGAESLSFDEESILAAPFQMKELRIKEMSENLYLKFDQYLAQCKALSYNKLSEHFQAISRDQKLLTGCRNLETVRYMHSLAKLDGVQSHLSKRERRELDTNRDFLLQQLPASFADEYELHIQLLDFANLLIAKYGFAATDHYNYRIRGRGLLVQCIDLMQLNECVVSADSLWLAVTLPTSAFGRVATPRTAELAKMFVTYAIRTLNFLMEADPRVSWRPPVTYSLMFWKKWNVKRILGDLQQSHRAFEKSLIEDIVTLSAPNQPL